MTNKRESTDDGPGPRTMWDQIGHDPERTLGESLRSMRTARGLSQEDVAQMMKMAGFNWRQTTVAKTEGGARPVRVNEAAALALCFGVTVNEMLGNSAETPRQSKVESAYRATFSMSLSTRLRAGEAKRRAESARLEYEASVEDLRHVEQLHEEARQAFDEAFGLDRGEGAADGGES